MADYSNPARWSTPTLGTFVLKSNRASTLQFSTNATNPSADQFAAVESGQAAPAPEAAFPSVVAECGFCFSIAASQLLAEYLLTGFGNILGTLAAEFHLTTTGIAWASCVHSVMTASMTLPFARLSDMYGGYRVFMLGMIWLVVWTAIAGHSNGITLFTVSRAMHGLALAAVQPASLCMVGVAYPPGKRRNIALGIFGASAPIGVFVGIACGTLTAKYNHWPWFFWAPALLSLLVTAAAVLTTPEVCRHRLPSTRIPSMDWVGSLTIVPGIILIIYALSTGSSPGGYFSNKNLLPLGLGVLLLCIAVYVELKVATCPLFPKSFFAPPSLKPFILACLFFYGCYGIFYFYATYYLQYVAEIASIQLLLYCIPWAAGGLVVALLGGLIMHIIPLTLLLFLSCLAWIGAPVLFIFVRPNQLYWKFVFPAMTCATFALNLTYTVSTVFITSSQEREFQGMAGAVCSVMLNCAVAFSLGIAQVIYSQTQAKGLATEDSYRWVFWFAAASAGVGFVICLLFVRIPKAAGDLRAPSPEANTENSEREERIRDPSPGAEKHIDHTDGVQQTNTIVGELDTEIDKALAEWKKRIDERDTEGNDGQEIDQPRRQLMEKGIA